MPNPTTETAGECLHPGWSAGPGMPLRCIECAVFIGEVLQPIRRDDRFTLARDGEQLVCYPRAIADRHAELVRLCEERLAGATDAGWLSRMKKTIDALHLHTSSEAPWPIPIPPSMTPSTPKTSSP